MKCYVINSEHLYTLINNALDPCTSDIIPSLSDCEIGIFRALSNNAPTPTHFIYTEGTWHPYMGG